MHGHNNQKIIPFKNGYLIPTAIAVGIVPFVTRLYCYTNDILAGYPWFMPVSFSSSDVFLAYKSFVLQILMAVMVIVFTFRMMRTKEKPGPDRSFLLLLIYLIFVILSGFFSQYPSLAFGGSFDRFEPVGVIASYVIICIYSYLTTDSEDDLKMILYISAVCYALMMLIGILQGFGADPFDMQFIKDLITPEDLKEAVTSMRVTRSAGTAYGTLYNENYIGMYISVFLPVCVMAVTLPIRKPLRIAVGILAAASLFVLYKSGSVSGWIALAGAAIFFIDVRLILNKRYRIPAIIATIVCIIAAVVAVFFIPSVREKALPDPARRTDLPAGRITDIRTEDDEVVFCFASGNELHSSFDFSPEGVIRPKFWDKDGSVLTATEEDGVYRLNECFEYGDAAVKAQPTEQPGIFIASFVIDKHQWPITNCTDGTYYYVNSGLNLVKFPQIRSAGIFNEGFMSGRGALWNRCIPLLGRHLLLGSGSNLFITDYQQDDYVKKTYSVGWGSFEYDVKPHSFYLCTWMENGLPALICIMGFFLLYIISGASLYGRIDYKDPKIAFTARIGLGLYIGCIAYMIISLANDSNVCTSPVFWAALGISMSVSKMNH